MKDFKTPHVSIIVSNYNGLNYLRKTIPPLMNLSYKNYEIIVVDNVSDDLSREYIENLSSVTFLSSGTVGAKNVGLNLGIEKAKGEFLLFLDCDVLVKNDNLLQSLIENFNKLEKIGLLSLTLVNEGEKKVYFYGTYLSKISFIRKNPRIDIDEICRIGGNKVVGVQGASFFTKRDLFKEIGYFDTIFPFGGEDVDVGIRSMFKGYSNYIYTEVVLTHIGMNERNDNSKFVSKLSYGTAGLYSTIIKNYSNHNLFLCLPIFIFYEFLRNLKDSIVRREYKIIFIYFKTLALLYEKRRLLFNKRKIIQKNRIIKKDTFFKLVPEVI